MNAFNAFPIGISTTLFREHPVSYALERIARAGYQAAEIWTWHLERSGEQARDLARQARKLGLSLTLHAPTEDVNPASRDRDIARHSRGQIAQALDTTVELGARVVVIHPGRKDARWDSPEPVWSRQSEWLSQLDDLAASLDVQIGLELMEKDPLEVFTLPRDAARLMKSGYQRVGLTVDLAHLNTHGGLVALLEQLEPAWIVHAHLSDSVPWQIHLPLGEGRLDIASALAALAQRYSGIVSLEGSDPGRGEAVLAANREYLRKLGYA